MTTYTFTRYEDQATDGTDSILKMTFKVEGYTHTEVTQRFADFLRGCGFVIGYASDQDSYDLNSLT